MSYWKLLPNTVFMLNRRGHFLDYGDQTDIPATGDFVQYSDDEDKTFPFIAEISKDFTDLEVYCTSLHKNPLDTLALKGNVSQD